MASLYVVVRQFPPLHTDRCRSSDQFMRTNPGFLLCYSLKSLPKLSKAKCRLKYDQHVSVIVHSAYIRAALILKSFHSRDPQWIRIF